MTAGAEAAPVQPVRLTLDAYRALRPRCAVSRELAVRTLAWAEPLARQALGRHAQRDQLGLGEALPVIPIVTTPHDNGGWGELMPVWFRPYERPLPIFILDNWAMPALLWRAWLGDEVGRAYHLENLLRIFVGSGLLLPFLPATQRGGQFLRHGALTVLLGLLWLPAADREALLAASAAGGRRFARAHGLTPQADLAAAAGQVELTAFLIAEGNCIGGEEKLKAFLANAEACGAYADLFGGLCLSLAALYDWYGPDWETWVFQVVNVDYRYASFGLEAWAKWLRTNGI